MGIIKDYSKNSQLMNITIKYGNEKFNFNLFKELQITEERINYELKEQPSSYAFLSLLHKKVLRTYSDKLVEADRVYGRLFSAKKGTTNQNTGRVFNDDQAKQYALKHDDYVEVTKEVNRLKEEVGILDTCVRSFEQRKDLLQTLSSNLRVGN